MQLIQRRHMLIIADYNLALVLPNYKRQGLQDPLVYIIMATYRYCTWAHFSQDLAKTTMNRLTHSIVHWIQDKEKFRKRMSVLMCRQETDQLSVTTKRSTIKIIKPTGWYKLTFNTQDVTLV